MMTQETDAKPVLDYELKRIFGEWRKRITTFSFSIDINELDKAKVRHYQDILRDIDNTTLPFEPTPLGEPVSEIYHGDKLVGYIM